ncbi:cysteine--tRNA ligase [Patescibacteria group bacterium]
MLKILNTLTRKKEEFKPINEKEVSFYHCGPTVYWVQHIGNMRAMVMADLISRSLKYLGYNVKLVRNYTDVGHLTGDNDEGEDKLAKGAKRENKTPQEIADEYIEVFESDLRDLNVADPQVKPRATEHIKEMIEMIEILLDKNYAYSTDLAVYFDVSKAKDYTRLSGQKLEENIQSAGKGSVNDKNKKSPSDFALWFFKAGVHKNALQTWKSPFQSGLVKNGEGFPGWHIECSVMSKKYLGDTLDVHMGGVEHIPVHHTNEIAQSESANGVKFVNYWLHNEHLTVNNGKMAKSEGTSYSVSDIKEKGFDPLVLRYLFLNAHYRSKQNFTWEALESAEKSLSRLRDKVLEIHGEIPLPPLTKGGTKEIELAGAPLCEGGQGDSYKQKFVSAIEDDFNVPQALAVIWELVKLASVDNSVKLELILEFDKVLGLNLANIENQKIEISDKIQKLVEERNEARANSDWKKADEIRDRIKGLGFVLEDSSGKTIIKK